MRRLGHQITEFGLTQKLLLQLRKGTSDQKSYREKRNALRTEKRLVEEELVDLLYGSNEAREEYIAILKQEKDPFVKREMMGATRRLGPILREELAAPLVASSDPGDRKLGVETLPRIGTQKSIDTLSDRAKNERDPEVQAAAVRALTHFVPERTGKEWADGSTIAPTLRELATNQQNLAIREMAFRGLIAQRHLSPEDREFVETFADHETDPNLKEIALSARRALAARR
ncbi:MAG TPA: HEAT repeat domain-containing protein [Bdellovibrionota bacterium]|nr:HEAT repeat domain-containing protein [Bdellovibrionota bacterium]